MKILSKLKNVITGVGIGILTFANKVFAISPEDLIIDPGMIETAYGIPRPSPIRMIFRIAKVFVIPISVLVGLIIYFKKSKSTKKKKIIVTIITLAVTAIIYFLLEQLYYYINSI